MTKDDIQKLLDEKLAAKVAEMKKKVDLGSCKK
jgi:hypothetical protein